ncbi:Peptidyl-tRNA hydrolase II family protein isoform 1 [Hibiscus syriacus]|uniref:Peptidyl-tRNA hydrolase II family protein isoform 1 n=1 Tax=Hibiscus syriacus TaxID=106335 RepID=A0A6A2YH13_HIBSY|nr:Peptidyl-tRNA hydrolase II family protein isoform 1 [Hibiscus syriacus]
MDKNLMDKVSAFGERVKVEGAEVGRKMSVGVDLKLDICDMINHERVNSVDLIYGIKRRMMLNSPRVQYLSLVLLETCVKNCDRVYSEVAAERIFDEMVKLIDDSQTIVNNRNKALVLIKAKGESTTELRYLVVYEETYKAKVRQAQFRSQITNSARQPWRLPILNMF